MKTLRYTLAAMAAAVALVGCGEKSSTATAAPGKMSRLGAELLDHVPADTPYIFGGLAAPNKKIQDKFKPMYRLAIEQYHSMFEQAATGLRDSDKAEASAQLINLMEVLAAETEDGDLGDLGFDTSKDLALVYGHGLAPVMRMTVSDPAAWDAFYARLTGALDEQPERVTVGGIEADRFGGGEAPFQFLIARDEGMLVATLAPAEASDAYLSMLMGPDKPAQSLADSGALKLTLDEYGFGPESFGIFDFQQVFSMLQTEGHAANDALFATNPDWPLDLGEVCSREIGGIISNAPRMLFGMTELSERAFDGRFVWEMSADAANTWRQMAGTMPALAADTDAAFKYGFAFDMQGSRELFDEVYGGIVESPYECSQLAPLNEMAGQALATLQQPIPPIVYNFRGFFVEMSSLQDIDFSSDDMPENLDLDLVLGFDNIEGLLAMGQMFVPQLAQFAIQPDGKAVALPAEAAAVIPYEGYAAMVSDTLAVSLGDNAASRAEARVAATGGSDEPLIGRLDMDAGAYFELISTLAALEDADTANMPAEQRAFLDEQQAQLRRMGEVYADLFDRMKVTVSITERGLEIPVRTTLK